MCLAVAADCDIQSNNWCTELDLFEGNQQSAQATVHTRRGNGGDGTCNQWGCAVNWGNLPITNNQWGHRAAELFGRGAAVIDTDRPFEVEASISAEGELVVELSQEGRHTGFFNRSSASNPVTGSCAGPCTPRDAPNEGAATGLPDEALAATAQASSTGMVLALSLWGNNDVRRWLDFECPNERRGGVGGSRATFSGFSLKPRPPGAPSTPAPPVEPPMLPPSSPPPLPPPTPPPPLKPLPSPPPASPPWMPEPPEPPPPPQPPPQPPPPIVPPPWQPPSSPPPDESWDALPISLLLLLGAGMGCAFLRGYRASGRTTARKMLLDEQDDPPSSTACSRDIPAPPTEEEQPRKPRRPRVADASVSMSDVGATKAAMWDADGERNPRLSMYDDLD